MTNPDFECSPGVRPGAFSLVEVIIAVGIFASCAVVVLSLLPSLVQQTADPAQFQTAQRMFDPLRIELQHLSSTVGFDALASSIPVMNTPLRDGLALVATADGMRTESESGSSTIATDERLFRVEVWRFSEAPLSYDSSRDVLPLYLRISWPYRLPGVSAATLIKDRNELCGTLALDR